MTDDLQQCIQSESSSYCLFKGMYADALFESLGHSNPSFLTFLQSDCVVRPTMHNLPYSTFDGQHQRASAQGPSGETTIKTKEKIAPAMPRHKLLPSSQAAMGITRQG